MDSRLGFHFIPDSFKIFLKVDLKEAARRIFNHACGEEKYSSVEETLGYLKKRVDSEKQRYFNYYGMNFPEGVKFDLVIDTTNLSPREVVEKILEFLPDKSCYKNKT